MVQHRVVTLAGTTEPPADQHQDLFALAIQMFWDVDGVVDVRNRINEVTPAAVQGAEPPRAEGRSSCLLGT
jgi:hypothetical protein